MKNKFVLSALIALALLLAACAPQATAASAPAPAATEAPTQSSSGNNPYGGNVYPTSEPTTAAAPPPTNPPSSSEAATVILGPGGFLVDVNGMTLYLFTKDTTSASTCSGGCARSWPPLIATGQPVAGAGVDASLLGTTPRADGSIQVTYNGHPLYYYKSDRAAGDKKGQGVGGVWYVVSATGDAMK